MFVGWTGSAPTGVGVGLVTVVGVVFGVGAGVDAGTCVGAGVVVGTGDGLGVTVAVVGGAVVDALTPKVADRLLTLTVCCPARVEFTLKLMV